MKTKALIFVLSKEYGELTGDDNWISNWEKYMLVRSISSGGAAGEQLVATTRFSCRSWSSCQTHACPSPPSPPPFMSLPDLTPQGCPPPIPAPCCPLGIRELRMCGSTLRCYSGEALNGGHWFIAHGCPTPSYQPCPTNLELPRLGDPLTMIGLDPTIRCPKVRQVE